MIRLVVNQMMQNPAQADFDSLARIAVEGKQSFEVVVRKFPQNLARASADFVDSLDAVTRAIAFQGKIRLGRIAPVNEFSFLVAEFFSADSFLNPGGFGFADMQNQSADLMRFR